MRNKYIIAGLLTATLIASFFLFGPKAVFFFFVFVWLGLMIGGCIFMTFLIVISLAKIAHEELKDIFN